MHLSGSVAVPSLEVLVQSCEFAKGYNWQRASGELAICAARIEGCQAGPRALLHELHHYALPAKIILADFNLAVSTSITKPPNLIPRQIFQLYSRLQMSGAAPAIKRQQ